MKDFQRLPQDLQHFARRKVLRRVVPCALLFIAFAVVLVLWGDIVFPIKDTFNKVVVYTVVMLLPFVFTGVPFKLFDRTFFGKVEGIEIDTRWNKGTRHERSYITNTYILTVRTTDGKVIEQKGLTTGKKLEHTETVYKVGDGVFHLYGSKHVVVFPETSESTLICPVCGSLNNADGKKCYNCGHTLVKDFPYSPKNRVDH